MDLANLIVNAVAAIGTVVALGYAVIAYRTAKAQAENMFNTEILRELNDVFEKVLLSAMHPELLRAIQKQMKRG
jgi:hypothetical protein